MFFILLQRLNVLLTRAKSLMIVIGNREKLYNFPSWQIFIKFCFRKGVARSGALLGVHEEWSDDLEEKTIDSEATYSDNYTISNYEFQIDNKLEEWGSHGRNRKLFNEIYGHKINPY